MTRSIATAKKNDKKGAGKNADPNERVVAQNRKAKHDYTILETLECGIALVGSEVKSMRTGQVSLSEAYGRIRDNEVWLIGCDIPEYTEANRFNHVPRRPRKLLLHRREIRRFAAQGLQQGLTLVPLRVYFKEGKAKVLLGICRGKQKHDKREDLKRTQARREIRQHIERRR
ncbi:MAG: SsrA-binding protein SmpB [Patescibacteria group bacterium]|nr:SsrA-binding protein SmpB [Patescibacteria group bacterium]